MKLIKKASWWKYIPYARDHRFTTLCGRIFVPASRWPVDPEAPIIKHEAHHLTQQKKYGLLFYVRYLLSDSFRLRMEAEAYAIQIRAEKPKDSLQALLAIDKYAKILSDGTYGKIGYNEAAKALSDKLTDII